MSTSTISMDPATYRGSMAAPAGASVTVGEEGVTGALTTTTTDATGSASDDTTTDSRTAT